MTVRFANINISVIAHRSLFYLDMVVHVAILVVRVPMIPDNFDV